MSFPGLPALYRLLVTGLVVLGALMSLAAQAEPTMPVSFGEILTLESRIPDRSLRYGSEPSQTAALWLPLGRQRREGEMPLLVLVHGGCWLKAYSAEHVYPLATALSRDGYAVFVPEYRRVGEKGGGWPGTAADILHALEVLADQVLPGVSREHTVLVGHSAGGHLALWAAGRDSTLLPPGITIVGAVGLAAIVDLETYARGDSSCQRATPALMGATPEQAPDRYVQASPARRALRVPTLLLRGSDDPIVGVEQLHALGGAQTLEVAGAGHFDWLHPETPAYAVLRDAVFDVLSHSYSGVDPQ